ncbi:MAG TPA: glycosyltransferase [Acidimicrobiia bacterium]|nr:glycosyltransferase [Acidimicrobiia bacterium]
MDALFESLNPPPEGVGRRQTCDLSVLIPCRNSADFLADQLEALAAQTWSGRWEVVIADNGSTDATRAVAAAYAERIPGLRVVDAAGRSGRHHACNVAARASTGAAIVFVDGDDAVADGYVEAMAAALGAHPVVAARLDHSTFGPSWTAGVGTAVQTDALLDGFGFLPFGMGCSLGFRREAFESLGGFREEATYCEDVDICWRAQLLGNEIAFVPDAVVHYRPRATEREMYRQHRNFGHARAFLYREFRADGMPRRTGREALAEWWIVAKAIPRLRNRSELARWSRRLGRCVGRLQGSARYRVWYP